MASNKLPQSLPLDVLAALEDAVKRFGSQSKVAQDLGVSGAVVNHLLKNRYPGDVATMAERIRGQYMAETVACPVMGDLGRRHCLDNQTRPLAHTNPVRVRLFHACKTCPNRKDMS
ncbi:hypothetical protein SAMN05216303_102318 [Rhodoferax sp. OV413]|uniref:XRE family transcriptional regulator n=1 Tax=Rhodoferax sp. OV413 TaxID=1855285 RepID=UPI000885EE48|nr:XRE family transcriptional regulator [Rhodoferax sp. OV413]SDO77326.1 hypothetical protein SAMN05216303_102318 [Rhodoferax sp. OV413]